MEKISDKPNLKHIKQASRPFEPFPTVTGFGQDPGILYTSAGGVNSNVLLFSLVTPCTPSAEATGIAGNICSHHPPPARLLSEDPETIMCRLKEFILPLA